jgi:hypothetical protein
MHNGAFVCLDDAIRHHVDVFESLANYSTERLDVGLHGPLGPVQPMLDRVHPLSGTPRALSDEEVRHITDFVRFALADPDAHPDRLRSLVPLMVPSGLTVHDFDFTVSAVDCF